MKTVIRAIISFSAVWLVLACSSPIPNSANPTSVSQFENIVPTPTTETFSESYPIIPIPPNVEYHGITEIGELTEVHFYAGEGVFSTDSGARSYGELLEKYGWQPCQQDKWCDWAVVTDTNFHGTYVYGSGETAPRLTIGTSAWPNADQNFKILFITNCGTLTETCDPSFYASRGCRVLLPEDQPAPATPLPNTLATPLGGPLPTKVATSDSDVIAPNNASRIQQYAVLDCQSAVHGVAFSPDSSLVATGSWDGLVRLWASDTTSVVRTLTENRWFVFGVAFSPNGQTVASAGGDSAVRVWDTSTGELQTTFAISVTEDGPGWFSDVAYSPDGSSLAAIRLDSVVRVWDLQSGKLIRNFEGFSHLSFSPDGTKLLTVSGGLSGGKGLRIWDANTGDLLYVPSQSHFVKGAVFGPDGVVLAIAVEQANHSIPIVLWDTSTDQLIRTLDGHQSFISVSLAFSPDGLTLATGSDDNLVKVWDVSTGQLLISLVGHTERITHITFSPDGKMIASSSTDGTVRLWSVKP